MSDKRLLVLSRGAQLYSTGRLLDAAAGRGMKAEVVSPAELVVALDREGPRLYRAGQPCDLPDIVLPRIGARANGHGLAALRQLELLGVANPNPADAIATARDKLHAAQILAAKGVRVPLTFDVGDSAGLRFALRKLGAPVIVKLPRGTQGLGVMLLESTTSAASVVEALDRLGHHALLQEYVRHRKGWDLRVLVVAGRAVAASERSASDDDFRANVHRGGSAHAVELTEAQRTAALRAAEVLGLGVAGVDLLDTAAGPVVLEVNASPGLQGIERATGVDAAGAIVDALAGLRVD